MLIGNFSVVNRDPLGKGRRFSLGQGEYGVSDESDLALTTVLGSCVAACIHDPVAGVGGMNHFVLARRNRGASGDPARYGDHLMPLLIEGLLQAGAKLNRLEAQVFGGASPGNFVNSIGQDNLAFACGFPFPFSSVFPLPFPDVPLLFLFPEASSSCSFISCSSYSLSSIAANRAARAAASCIRFST